MTPTQEAADFAARWASTPQERSGMVRDIQSVIDATRAALRETHHLVPKDQEPDAWVKPNWKDPANYDGTSPVTVYPRADWTPLYALEKRHD
jgi:hypothetical protein